MGFITVSILLWEEKEGEFTIRLVTTNETLWRRHGNGLDELTSVADELREELLGLAQSLLALCKGAPVTKMVAIDTETFP